MRWTSKSMTCWKRYVARSLQTQFHETNLVHRVQQQKDNKHLLDLEYVQLNVPKVLGLLKKVFAKR